MRKQVGFGSLIFLFLISGCLKMQQSAMTQAPPPPIPSNPVPMNSNQTPHPPPLPPPQMTPVNSAADDYENAELESVLPGSSNAFDPFTYGRPGSPYGPGKIFAPGLNGLRCGPINLPMSSQFADPGDSQAVLIISGNGFECSADIDHDKPGAAITFSLVAAIFTNPPFTITSQTATTVTITNGSVTLRLTFRITPTVTLISKVEYL